MLAAESSAPINLNGVNKNKKTFHIICVTEIFEPYIYKIHILNSQYA